MRLSRHRAGKQGLPGPGRPVEEHAARDPRPELRVALRVLQEVHHLDQLVLGLVDPGHVVERDPLLLASREPARGRAAEATENAARSRPHLAAREPDEEGDQQDRREEAEQERPQERAAGVRRLGVDDDVPLVEQLGDLSGIDERGDLGLEFRVHRYGFVIARRVVGRLVLQLSLDRVLLRADLLDVPGLDLVGEERLVGHPRAVLGAAGDDRDHDVHHQQPEQERDERPAARDHRRLGLGLGAASVWRRIHAPARRLRLPRRGCSQRAGRRPGRSLYSSAARPLSRSLTDSQGGRSGAPPHRPRKRGGPPVRIREHRHT